MSRERRTGLAIAVAVFLSGAALLGLEITASRRARADVRELALRLGLADRDRPHGTRDRLLGGRDRRRPAAEPVPPHLAAHPRCGARRARARDRPDRADVDRRLGSGAATRPVARCRDPLRPGEHRPRLRLADRRQAGGELARARSAAPPAASSRSQPREVPALDKAIADRWARPVRFDDVPVLTDDYAPTDALLAD